MIRASGLLAQDVRRGWLSCDSGFGVYWREMLGVVGARCGVSAGDVSGVAERCAEEVVDEAEGEEGEASRETLLI